MGKLGKTSGNGFLWQSIGWQNPAGRFLCSFFVRPFGQQKGGVCIWQPIINCSVDASGARQAASQGHVVVIVDIIDMSTTLEAALEAGARKVYGASPDGVIVPVDVKPEVIGLEAGKKALQHNCPVIVVAEPRWDDRESRIRSCAPVLRGLKKAGIKEYCLLPNLGASTVKLADFQNSLLWP